MSSASVIDLYEHLASDPDEKSRARLLAEAFEQMEDRYPQITGLATASNPRESELRLRKETEQIRAETQREMGQVRMEIEKLRAEGRRDMPPAKVDIFKWGSALLIAQFAAILWAILRFAAH